jgi:hypothetical protein
VARGSLGRKSAPSSGTSSGLLSGARAAPSSLTPDGDGLDDVATVTFTLAAPATVTATLTAPGGVVVSTLMTEPRPAGPNSFTFVPQNLATGSYAIVLTATAADGRVTTASVPVSVGPLVSRFAASAALFSPNGDGRLDRLEFRFGLAAPADVQLRVLRGGFWVATVFAGALQPGPQVLSWDGRKRLGRLLDGRYEAELTAPGFVRRLPFTTDTRAPRLRLLRLRPLRLSVNEAAEVVLTVDGRRRTLRRRSGGFAVPGRPPRRLLRAVARDAAGNVGRPLVLKR